LQSVYANGLRHPEDVIQHCLTLFRKVDTVNLVAYLSKGNADLAASAGSLPERPSLKLCEEAGPLARFAHVLDLSARRVLPKHLLRRSMVLSSLHVGPDSFQQRLALAAYTGEEAVFDWTLLAVIDDDVDCKSIDDASQRRWIVQNVKRGVSIDQMSLPSTPHPRFGPESVIAAQLAALQSGNIFEAACFNVAGIAERSAACGKVLDEGLHEPSRNPIAHSVEGLRRLLALPSHAVLLGHADAVWGRAALPTQSIMVQEVSVRVQGSPMSAAGSSSSTFLWEVSLHKSNSCWMTSAITPVYTSVA